MHRTPDPGQTHKQNAACAGKVKTTFHNWLNARASSQYLVQIRLYFPEANLPLPEGRERSPPGVSISLPHAPIEYIRIAYARVELDPKQHAVKTFGVAFNERAAAEHRVKDIL